MKMYFTLDIYVQDHIYNEEDGTVDLLMGDKQIYYEDYSHIQDLLVDLRYFNINSNSLVYRIYYSPMNGDDVVIDITEYVGLKNSEQAIVCLDEIIKEGGHAEHFKYTYKAGAQARCL